MTSYRTKQGDMWDIISYNLYGSDKYANILMEANTAYRKTYIFSAGAVLDIPSVETTTTSSTLPPWKKASG